MLFWTKNRLLKSLLDEKNKELWNEVNSIYNIKLKRYKGYIYASGISQKRAKIYIPNKNISSSLFTHELLHLKLNASNLHIGFYLFKLCENDDILSCIFNYQNSMVIGNLLEHEFTYKQFIALGYKEDEFVCDYNTDKFTDKDKELIKNSTGIDYDCIYFFISKYIVLKTIRESNRDYSDALMYMHSVNIDLFFIADQFYQKIKELFQLPVQDAEIIIISTINNLLEMLRGYFLKKISIELNRIENSYHKNNNIV